MNIIEHAGSQMPAYHSHRQLESVTARALDASAAYSPAETFELVEQIAVHGLTTEFDAFTRARKSQIMRSRSLGRYVMQYKRFLDRCKATLGQDFSASLQSELLSDAPQLIRRERDATRLLIVVPTFYNNVMMSLPLLDKFLEPHGIDTLYLKATHSAFPYYTGLFGFGHNRDMVIKTLTDFINSRGYKRVDLIGASSGGFFALWLGAQFSARKVCVYGSDITPTMRSKHLARSNIARSMAEDPIGELCDLSAIERIYAFSGNLRSRDVECLTYLEQFANVEPHLEMAADHLVLLNMIMKGYDFAELAD